MAKLSLFTLSLSLLLLLLLHGSLARQQEVPSPHECRFDQLTNLEPTDRMEFEAGRMDLWDHTSPEFRCAGVAVARTTINPKGLLLPTFFSSPGLAYVIQGEGVVGTIMPGCPETFQETRGFQPGEEQEGEQQQQRRRFWDMHQKLRRLRRGEVIALPAGLSHWCYNDGDAPIVIVTLLDITNRDNQLDQNPRMFQIAGSAPQGQEQRHQQRLWASGGSILREFDPQIIADSFNIDLQTAKQLQKHDGGRGHIVRVRGSLRFISPSWEPRESSRPDNVFEENFCTERFQENIDNPSRADVYSSRAGRISTLNSFTLPVLRRIRLNAARGVLYSNGMVLPHWNQNAHSVMYVTGGRARVQVVDDNGKSVFNGEVQQGQVLVIPQGFPVVKRAEQDGFEWISFRTNDNAKVNTIAGRTSLMRALPADVIAAAYGVSREDAKRIKFSRDETSLTTVEGARG